MQMQDLARRERPPHIGLRPMASAALRVTALIAFAVLLILVLLPVALVAAGT